MANHSPGYTEHRKQIKIGKALVVDDSRTIRMIIRRILIELGYEVCEASNGKEALDVIEAEKTKVNLVLADWNMPRDERIGPGQAASSGSRIFFAESHHGNLRTEMGQMILALDAGANEYVMKPFTKNILKEKLELLGIPSFAGEYHECPEPAIAPARRTNSSDGRG